MRPFPDTEDQSFIDKVESKVRQLIFKYGSEGDPAKRKLLEQQITRNNKLIKQIQPYYRYQKLKNEQKNLRLLLQETEKTLGDLNGQLQKIKKQNAELTEMKSLYQYLMNQVAKGKEYEYKISALNNEIMLIEDLGHFQDRSFIEKGLECISLTKKQLLKRKDDAKEEKSQVKQKIFIFSQDIQHESAEWKRQFERKNQLIKALNAEKAKSIAFQIQAPLDRKSVRSEPEKPRQIFQIRKKTLNINKIEKKDEKPTVYIIWTLILLVWAWWLWSRSKLRALPAGDEMCY